MKLFAMLLSQFDLKMFHEAEGFFKVALNIDNSEIPIEVKLVDNIGKGSTGGRCGPVFTDDSTFDNLKIEKISIKIKHSCTVIGMIEALAHEMVHAKQYIDKDITVSFERYYFWGFIPRIKARKFWKGQDTTDLDYYDQPCEMEAYLLQKKLTFDYLNIVQKNLDPLAMAKLLHTQTESNID